MEQNQQNTFLIPLAIIVAGGFVAAAIYFGTGSDSPVATTSGNNQNVEIDLVPVTERDHIIGSRSAALVIVEYSDTECPFCKIFHNTMLTIMQEYGKEEKVAWVYRHFPIAELHSKSFNEAVAQECAGNLGGNSKFWEYTNKLYEGTPSNNDLDPAELTKIATEVGLSSTAFNVCLESGEFDPKVNFDIQNAQEIGITGTPHSIIIDTKTNEYHTIEGAYPYIQIKTAIDLILSQ